MPPVFAGRYAAHTDEPFVVFMVGLCINKPWAIPRWFPAFAAMLPMVNELRAHPEKGMFHSRTFLSFPVIMLVQYWRSFEHLEAFARSPADLHMPAWQRFYREVGKSDAVGVFHETYLVSPDQCEAIYVNMPRFGLALAAQHTPATGRRLTARQRLGGDNQPAVSPAPYHPENTSL
jgi:hypothetical protein